MKPEEHFPDRLMGLRMQAGLTREELAEKAGISVTFIRDLEQGHRAPSWATVLAIAGVLGVDVGEFAKEHPEKFVRKKGRTKKEALPKDEPGSPQEE